MLVKTNDVVGYIIKSVGTQLRSANTRHKIRHVLSIFAVIANYGFIV